MKPKAVFIFLLLALVIGYFVFTMLIRSDRNQNFENNGSPTSSEILPSQNSDGELAIEPAALVVRRDLKMRLGVDEKKITILEVENKMWNNGCLGLEERGEMCSQALVSGFRVLLSVGGKEYAYRTNMDGTVFRAESGFKKTGEVNR
jgi:hypothetical protein